MKSKIEPWEINTYKVHTKAGGFIEVHATSALGAWRTAEALPGNVEVVGIVSPDHPGIMELPTNGEVEPSDGGSDE